MIAEQKLALFDIDGTIAAHRSVPESVITGLRHIQSLGFLTTVSTGRGFNRMREVLGENFNTIVSPESFIIVEHGTKIVDREGNVVRADYFEPNEIEHIVAFSRSNADIIRLLWFMSPDPHERVQIWCKRPEDIAEEMERRGHYATIFSCSFDELKERLLAYPLSSASAKLESFIRVQNLKLHFTRSEIDTIFQDGMMEYIRNVADKSKAVLYLEQHYGISVENMLVAGNAINDVDMLNLSAGRRILVGPDTEAATVLGHLRKPEEVIRVDSPEALGLYLQTLS